MPAPADIFPRRMIETSQATIDTLRTHNGVGIDPWHAFDQLIGFMVDRAREAAATTAVSYRGFLVGAAMFAFNSRTGRTAIVRGENLKPSSESPKICAEKVALHYAADSGYDLITGMVVHGPQQTDTDSHKDSPTLHPCGTCREMFTRHPLIVPETRVVTVGAEDTAVEYFTVDTLLAFHSTET